MSTPLLWCNISPPIPSSASSERGRSRLPGSKSRQLTEYGCRDQDGRPQSPALEAALERTHLPLWWSRTEWKRLWARPGVKAGERATFSPSLPRLLAKATRSLAVNHGRVHGGPFLVRGAPPPGECSPGRPAANQDGHHRAAGGSDGGALKSSTRQQRFHKKTRFSCNAWCQYPTNEGAQPRGRVPGG